MANTTTRKKVIFRVITDTQANILAKGADDALKGRLAISTDTRTVFVGDGTKFVPNNNQFDTMPTPSSAWENVIIQYSGADTTTYPKYLKGRFYQCSKDGSTYKWNDISYPVSSDSPYVINLSNGIDLTISGSTCTITIGGRPAYLPATVPVRFRPKKDIWFTGTQDWTSFSGLANVNPNGQIKINDNATTPQNFFGSASWAIDASSTVLDLGNSVFLLVGDNMCTLIFSGASNFNGKTIPQQYWPLKTTSCVCTSNWTSHKGLAWIDDKGVISNNGQSGNYYGSCSWQYKPSLRFNENPPSGSQYAGYVGSVPTQTDGKIRIYTAGSTLTGFSTAGVTYENKRTIRLRGCFRSNATSTAVTAPLGKLYWGNKLVSQSYDTWTWGMCWQQNGAVHACGYRERDGLVLYRGPSQFGSSYDLWVDIQIPTNFDLY